MHEHMSLDVPEPESSQDSPQESPYVLLPQGASSAHIQQILDVLPAGAYTCNKEGLITYFNAYAQELWGRSPKLYDPADRFSGAYKLYQPDGTPLRHEDSWVALAIKNCERYVGREICIERPDGTRRTALAHASPLYDAQGACIGAVNVLVDITERETENSETVRASATLTTIVKSSPLPIIVIDAEDSIVRMWNPAAEAMFGWKAAEVLGKELPIIPENLVNEFKEKRRRVKRGSRYAGLETMRLTKSGKLVPVSFSAAPLKVNGKVTSILLMNVDEKERRKAEEALKHADRSKDEFLATLAHELRNPLAPMRNAIEILDLKGVPTPEAQWALEIMNRQMQQMTRLIDDLLDIARITGNKLELRCEKISLNDVLHVATETSKPIIESAGHELFVATPEDDIFVDGDLVRIAQVVSNLLNNAAKYTEGRGKIWLGLEARGEFAYITVRDTGIGISPEMLPRVFDMFTQVHTSAHRSGGLGVGLTLAKRLVDLHNGTIEVHSEGAGKGSTFAVRLPLLAQSRKRKEGGQSTRAPETMPSMRILVVDDNEDSVATLEVMLRMSGHDIRTGRDGVEAVDVANRFRPDVVLLDIGMPRMNGYEAAETIRKQSWGRDMVLIAMTGWGQESDRERSAAAGFSHHLVKPVDLDVLQRILLKTALEHGRSA